MAAYSVLNTENPDLMENRNKNFSFSSPFTYSASNYRSIFTYKSPINFENSELTKRNENIFELLCRKLLIFTSFVAVLLVAPISMFFVVKKLNKSERMIIFRLGRLQSIKGPGMVFVLPVIDRCKVVDLRMNAFNIPAQQLIISDDAIVEVEAEIRFRVTDVIKSTLHVKDLNGTLRNLGRNLMINCICKKNTKDIEKETQKINEELLEIFNDNVRHWGLEVSRVDLTPIRIVQNSQPHPALGRLLGALQNSFQPHQTPQVVQTPDTVQLILEDTLKTAQHSGQLKDIDARFRVEISSDRNFYFAIKNGHAYIQDVNNDADVVINVSKEDFLAIFQSELTPLQAYISGRLKVSGDIRILMSLESALQAQKTSKHCIITV